MVHEKRYNSRAVPVEREGETKQEKERKGERETGRGVEDRVMSMKHSFFFGVVKKEWGGSRDDMIVENPG